MTNQYFIHSHHVLKAICVIRLHFREFCRTQHSASFAHWSKGEVPPPTNLIHVKMVMGNQIAVWQ